MHDLDILQQMIKDTAQVSLTDKYGKKMVTLTEPQCPDSCVTIYGMPDDAIVIKADDFRSPDTVFNGSRGECKRADFVIVANAGIKKAIIYIELKKTKGSEREIIQQLTGARCFVAYCREIGQAQAFWNQRTFLTGYVERFVSIGHTSIPKRKTRIARQTGAHDRPDKMLKIDSPYHLEFNRLVGRNR